MAKYNAGYLSPIKNKLGNAVGRKWRNIDVLAVYQPNVRNPRTTAQMANRNKLSVASHAGSMLRAAIRIGLTGITKNTRVFPRAKFVSLNVASMPTTGLTIPYSQLIVAKGSTPAPIFKSPIFDAETNPVQVDWDGRALDGVIPSDALLDIKVYAVVLCPAEGASIVSSAAFSEGTVSIGVPNSWMGKEAFVYGFARYEGAGNEEAGLISSMASDSSFVGTGTIG